MLASLVPLSMGQALQVDLSATATLIMYGHRLRLAAAALAIKPKHT